MSDRKAALKSKLKDSRQLLDAILDQVGDREDAQVYSNGLGWNVRQLTAHLADAERGHYNQASNIAEGNDLVPPDFDIQRYNTRTTEKNMGKTIEQSRAELNEWRAKFLEWLDALDEEKFDRKGRHASLEVMSVYDIVHRNALHEKEHAVDIAHALDIKVS
jgi:hypothetical protein